MASYITLATLALLAITVDTAAFKPPINNTLEQGVATECKTCPYSLCTNKAFYDYNTQVSLVCWTQGTVIDEDATWLRTSDECYVTQYDLMDISPVEYETVLSYCGAASEELKLTYDEATVKYDAECNICPDNASCETIKYLSPGTALTTTCWTDDGGPVIGDTTWLKTTDNCYVNELHLGSPADKAVLDNCGAIGFIQTNDTSASTASRSASNTLLIPKPAAASTPKRRSPSSPAELHKRYLINMTVGEDFAACHAATTSASAVVKRYPFDAGVWMQCYATNATAADPAEEYWYKTTDFCYVREVDFWESLFDQYRFPSCELFG